MIIDNLTIAGVASTSLVFCFLFINGFVQRKDQTEVVPTKRHPRSRKR